MATTSFEGILEKVRVQFLFDHPFLSVLALSLPTVRRTNPHELFETDGYHLYLDESKVLGRSPEVLKYQYTHTLLHILLKHAGRLGGRDLKIWNRSCDIVINLLLDTFERVGERPEDEPLLEKFRDASVEEVYHVLEKESREGEGETQEAQTQEKRDLIEGSEEMHYDEQIDALIVQAVAAARKQGNLPGTLIEMIDEAIQPRIDLQTLLHAYITESYFDKNVDFRRPNRRFIHQGLYLPGFVYEKNRLALTIALDRSMSISRETFAAFQGMIETVLQIAGDYLVRVVPFDEKVYAEEVVTYASSEPKAAVRFGKGNGGTDFSPVVDYIDTLPLSESASLLIVLSDGFFTIRKMVDVPTLFLISEKKNMTRLANYGHVVYFDL